MTKSMDDICDLFTGKPQDHKGVWECDHFRHRSAYYGVSSSVEGAFRSIYRHLNTLDCTINIPRYLITLSTDSFVDAVRSIFHVLGISA